MKEKLHDRLARFGQQHLLRFGNELDEDERELLASDIRGIDFDLVASLYGRRNEVTDFAPLAERMTGPPAFRLGAVENRFAPDEARNRGIEVLRAGRVGVILVAGGKGTRLEFDHPKGIFPIGPVSHHSLFQIHIEKIVAASRRYRSRIPLYLMTSPATHDETVEFLAERDRFRLPKEDLTVFCQATMPSVDAKTGKVLLAKKHRVELSPDGHGGTLAALERHGCLEGMRKDGIEHLFYLQIDNPLVEICSPELLGYHVLCRSEMSTQVVAKNEADDRVGNVVQVDGRLHVIEYIHWPEVVRERPSAGDPARFWAGSIAVHGFERAFLERMAAADDVLRFHVSEEKRVAYVDPSGNRVVPEEPNALKFERFIFDLMPSAENAIVVEVDADEHFAPLKNAPGNKEDTPETVQAQMVALHTGWLRKAGAELADGVAVEISPLFALDAAEVAEKISPGTQISRPRYFE
jgi:UDP-N-acetylglucosamine/UDP-N-acetylgalactosamine diphosphorylase